MSTDADANGDDNGLSSLAFVEKSLDTAIGV